MPGSARGHAALEVAQEAAHAAGAPRGGGDGGLVGLDVGVVLLLVPRRPDAWQKEIAFLSSPFMVMAWSGD